MPTPNHFPIAAHMRELADTALSTVLLERDCLAFGLSTFRTSGQTFIAADPNGEQIGFNKAGTVLNSRPAAPLTRNKHSTRLILQNNGVPVPRGRRFDQSSMAAAVAYAEELGYPVVLKPLHGAQGQGVVTGIADAADLEWAFQDVASSTFADDDIIVEEQIEGEAYRIIVVGERAVSALISRRGAVTGDGERTVRQLVEDRQLLRQQNPHLMSRPISIDDRMQHLLTRQQAGLDDVLGHGRTVEFTYGSNTHLGGEPAQVLKEVHPTILEASVRAVQALPGLGFGGVDFLVPDIRRPLTDQRAAICEINSLPAVDSHEYPLYGEAVSVMREMVVKSAEHSGLSLEGYSDQVSLNVKLDAPRFSARYQFWLWNKARKMGLRCGVRRDGKRRLAAHIRGDVHYIAVWLALARHHRRQASPRAVEVKHA